MHSARQMAVVLAGLVGPAGATVSVVLGLGEPDHGSRLAIVAVVVTYAVVAAVVLIGRPGAAMGPLLMVGSLGWGVGEGLLALGVEGAVTSPGSMPWAAAVGVLGTAVRATGWLTLALMVPLLFPDGRSAWPGRRLPVVLGTGAVATFALAALLSPVPLESRLASVTNPLGLPVSLRAVADTAAVGGLVLAAVALVVAVAGLVRRWRTGDELQHQRLLWFVVAFCLPLLVLPVAATPWARPWMFAAATLPAPVAIGVAVFQRRLYDIQLVVSRTLTYVLLSVAVGALHALTVAGVGALLRDSDAAWLPWVAAGVVAAAVLPLRDALQLGVTRLTHGQWSVPATVLAASGRRLADAADVPALLSTLVREVALGLRLQRVAVLDHRGRVLARWGDPGDAPADVELPLLAYGVPVGALTHSPQPLRATDRELLADVARQLGGVVHSAALLDTIRDGQDRLVRAREEERRRLRRDLHDGLGPTLAALTLQVDTLRNRHALAVPLAAGGASAPTAVAGPVDDLESDLLRLRSGIQATVADVRRVVEGLRPPSLDEDGLDGALRRLVDQVEAASALTVHLDLDAPGSLPAAVEVAVFRVAQEALTNVVRHSGAAAATLRLEVEGDTVTLRVSDDGSGPGPRRAGGLGLVSMRERAEEIGGTLVVDGLTTFGRGTRVLLRVPRTTTTPEEVNP